MLDRYRYVTFLVLLALVQIGLWPFIGFRAELAGVFLVILIIQAAYLFVGNRDDQR